VLILYGCGATRLGKLNLRRNMIFQCTRTPPQAILNLVTAIIVENVMDISREVQLDHLQKQEEDKRKQILEFAAIFNKLDVDGDGQLSLEEIENGDGVAEVSLKLASLNAVDSGELFRILDVDGNGVISIEEFIQGKRGSS
jgi:hypothetical protein